MSKYVQFHGARAKLRPSLTPCVSKTRRKSMKRLCAVVLFCTIAAPRVFGDAQDTVVFRAQMLPDNEIPAIAAAGNSAAAAIVVHVTRDDKGNINAATVTFNVDYKVTSALTFTGLHIHNAPAGLNGPVVIDSGISGSNTVSAVAGPGRITRVVNYASTDTNGLKFVTGLLTTPETYLRQYPHHCEPRWIHARVWPWPTRGCPKDRRPYLPRNTRRQPRGATASHLRPWMANHATWE